MTTIKELGAVRAPDIIPNKETQPLKVEWRRHFKVFDNYFDFTVYIPLNYISRKFTPRNYNMLQLFPSIDGALN